MKDTFFHSHWKSISAWKYKIINFIESILEKDTLRDIKYLVLFLKADNL